MVPRAWATTAAYFLRCCGLRASFRAFAPQEYRVDVGNAFAWCTQPLGESAFHLPSERHSTGDLPSRAISGSPMLFWCTPALLTGIVLGALALVISGMYLQTLVKRGSKSKPRADPD